MINNLLFFIMGFIAHLIIVPILESLSNYICQLLELRTALVGQKIIKINQELSEDKQNEKPHVYGFAPSVQVLDEEGDVE